MRRFVLIIYISALLGCGYRDMQLPVTDQGGNSSMGSLDFASVRAKVFAVYCLRCHSQAAGNKAGINLETYPNVSKNLSLIGKVVNTSFMPPTRPLPPGDLNYLNAWIQAGAPEAGTTNPGPR